MTDQIASLRSVLAPLIALSEKAKPLPWELTARFHAGGGRAIFSPAASDGDGDHVALWDALDDEDGDFIVALVNALPALVALASEPVAGEALEDATEAEYQRILDENASLRAELARVKEGTHVARCHCSESLTATTENVSSYFAGRTDPRCAALRALASSAAPAPTKDGA